MTEPPSDNLSFEQALAELERIVRQLEDGQIGLEESLSCYEQGVSLLKRCYGQLRQAEQRIVQLTGVDESDKPLSRPFDHTAATETNRNVANRPAVAAPPPAPAADPRRPAEVGPDRSPPPETPPKRTSADVPELPF
jgi:exodeoxyribonuclease VII small subunit